MREKSVGVVNVVHLRGFCFCFCFMVFVLQKIYWQTEAVRVIIESCEIDNEKSRAQRKGKKERNK